MKAIHEMHRVFIDGMPRQFSFYSNTANTQNIFMLLSVYISVCMTIVCYYICPFGKSVFNINSSVYGCVYILETVGLIHRRISDLGPSYLCD